MTTWFTSDQHFNHFNIIRYCNRPFSSIIEMNGAIMDRWNEVVKPPDEVYVLGDFSFCPMEQTKSILDALNGTKHLVLGNHDRRKPQQYKSAGFSTVQRRMETPDWHLEHKPRYIPSGDHPSYNFEKWTLCGHVHDRWDIHYSGMNINVGVDQHNFYPVSEEQLFEIRTKAISFISSEMKK